MTKLAIFGAVACGVWWLLGDSRPTGKPRAERAARRVPRAELAARATAGDGKTSDAHDQAARNGATPAFAKPLQPKTEAEVGKLRIKLGYAGFRSETAASIFLGLKFDRPGRRLRSSAVARSASATAVTSKSLMYTVGSAGVVLLPARSRPLVPHARRGKTTSSSACPMRST